MKKKLYVPERLFIHNLIHCCGISTKKLCSDLNDLITEKIDFEINCLKTYAEEGNLTLTYSFKKQTAALYSNSEKKHDRKRQKNPDYVLLKCYNIIKDLADKYETDFMPSPTKPNINKEVIKYIDGFSDYIVHLIDEQNACAVSQRSLDSILEPYGNQYTPPQYELTQHIISKIIPNIFNSNRDTFLDFISYKNWKELITYDINTNKQVVFFSCSQNVMANKEKYFEEQFKNLFSLNNDESQQIGDILSNIHKRLKELYNNGVLTCIPNQQISEEPPVYDDTIDYDAIISSSIIGFMRWIPMISDEPKKDKFIECVQDIIEIIRPSALPQVKNAKQSENIFLLNDNLELRKTLIGALCSNSYFQTLFNKYYKA